MTTKYKVIVISMAIISVFSLASCKNKNKHENNVNSDKNKVVDISSNKSKKESEENTEGSEYKDEFQKIERLPNIEGLEVDENSDRDPSKYVKFSDSDKFNKDISLKEFVKNSNMGKNLNESIYNTNNIKNKEYIYTPDVYKMKGSASNLGENDYLKLKDHYKAEYLANRFGIDYTMQDVMNYYTQKTGTYKIEEPEDMQDLLESEWLQTQMVGFDEGVLNSELDYVTKVIQDKVYKQVYTNMTEEDESKAIDVYGPALIKEGLQESEVKSRAKEMYATTSSYISNDLYNQAELYSNLKILKEFLPEKYKQIMKSQGKTKIGELYENYSNIYHED